MICPRDRMPKYRGKKKQKRQQFNLFGSKKYGGKSFFGVFALFQTNSRLGKQPTLSPPNKYPSAPRLIARGAPH